MVSVRTTVEGLFHEMRHLKHWAELVSHYRGQGVEEKEAGILAYAAFHTPEGKLSTESFAQATLFDWLSRGNRPADSPTSPNPAKPRQLFPHLHYPTFAALEATAEMYRRVSRQSGDGATKDARLRELRELQERLLRAAVVRHRSFREAYAAALARLTRELTPEEREFLRGKDEPLTLEALFPPAHQLPERFTSGEEPLSRILQRLGEASPQP